MVSNKLGPSDPNIHPKVILAKDPWGEFLQEFRSESDEGVAEGVSWEIERGMFKWRD